jgi:NAD dependent epimerase/dehydratase family enzyme
VKVVIAGGSGSLGRRIAIAYTGHRLYPRLPHCSKVGTVILRTDPALSLTGRHATSKVLRESNFEFDYDTLIAALVELVD